MGSKSGSTFQVYGGVPPVAVNVRLAGEPEVPLRVSFEVSWIVTVGGVRTGGGCRVIGVELLLPPPQEQRIKHVMNARRIAVRFTSHLYRSELRLNLLAARRCRNPRSSCSG